MATSNSYEEARNQRLLENKKRFEDLGILKISKTLSDISNSGKKSKQREVKPKIRNAQILEPRRSTRARKPVVTYQDEVGKGLFTGRRSKSASSWTSNKERIQAIKSAEKLQSNLQSEYPSFVKSMVRSHVYRCFWLGLPRSFCKKHLPKSTGNIMLEDEEGNEYDCVFFISGKIGQSGGWRAFALKHKLDDGDALVFELVERTRFKIYVVKASDGGSQVDDDDNVDEEAAETKKTSRPIKKLKKTLENGKKPAAKNSALNQEDDDDMSNVDNEAEETKKTSMPTKKLKKTLENGKKPAAKNSALNQEDDDEMSNVDNEAEETQKSSMPTKMLKMEINSPVENGKKATAENCGQSKKPSKSEEAVTGSRRSTRNRN